MYRRNVALNPLARACQFGALLLLLFGVLSLLAHTIVVERQSQQQAVGTNQDVR